ncbi:MAG: DNA mismatch repair protein MutH, partial [Alphaproteobacteria bacterium]|nr:DNA mismatch repair protein MutH [Alphaproteobacteria bacterium]
AVAARFGLPVPDDLRRHKGWIGQLVETALGATASSRALPDFPHLGIELKTLPVDATGRPRESTYVCTLPLDGSLERDWDSSWVRHKLSAVLWVPVVGDDAPGDRVVGTPFVWHPSAEEEALLRADWEAVADLAALGELWHLTARHGKVLQVRPKAASASSRAWVRGEEGWVRDNPRGFYLRPTFTHGVLARHLRLPGGAQGTPP